MQREASRDRRRKLIGIIKILILIGFLVMAVIIVRFTPAGELLSPKRLNALLAAAGVWAPVVYIVVYAVGACLFVPGILLTAVGAAVFGPWQGFFYVWIGAMLGASGAFVIGRYLGRDFAASLIGPRLRKYDEAIGRNGFATVLYLRLVYFPFTPMNFGMGLTGVRFKDYLLGTGIGILVGTFVFTFFIGTLRQVWVGGDWSRLNGWQTYLSLGLFIFSLFLPKIIKIWRKDPASPAME